MDNPLNFFIIMGCDWLIKMYYYSLENNTYFFNRTR